MTGLSGLRAVVTGGGSGLRFTTARRMAAQAAASTAGTVLAVDRGMQGLRPRR
jgi:NAD(P)-dependent dehydrogenase (short-subunit alcohol dehydrogenase family)